MDEGLQARYLGVLGLTREAATEGLLKEIVGAHAARVPFENISKLHWRRTLGLTALPDLRLFLTGIEDYGFGGTCYANNYHLFSLLRSLGFDATLCGADMANPNVQMVVRVRVEGREVLVDVGYAAPFREPLPADLASEYIVDWALSELPTFVDPWG
jgi:N-hydroxyarylamine O-acetyltransferase